MSNLDVIFKVPLSGGGLILPLSFLLALSRELSPLERRPSMICTDRPQMESWPCEFLLHLQTPPSGHSLSLSLPRRLGPIKAGLKCPLSLADAVHPEGTPWILPRLDPGKVPILLRHVDFHQLYQNHHPLSPGLSQKSSHSFSQIYSYSFQ